MAPHDFSAMPPFFSFGAHSKAFLDSVGNGMSGLVLTGGDAREEVETFRRAGLETYAPFDFERKATLPDGTQVTVAFSLAFVTSPAMPRIVFFTCHQRAPQYFWKPEFQTHANGAQRIAAVYTVAEDPAAHRAFFEGLTGAVSEETAGGLRLPCGDGELLVLTPDRIIVVDPSFEPDLAHGPYFAGFAIETDRPPPERVPAGDFGAFIEWRAA
jgi:hypothetical protein